MPHVRGCPESSHRQRAGAGSGAACGSPLALEASRAFRRSYCGKLGGGGFAAAREADASRPRRTLTLQERADRSESGAAAEAERAHAAELERDRAQEEGREARGKLSEITADGQRTEGVWEDGELVVAPKKKVAQRTTSPGRGQGGGIGD